MDYLERRTPCIRLVFSFHRGIVFIGFFYWHDVVITFHSTANRGLYKKDAAPANSGAFDVVEVKLDSVATKLQNLTATVQDLTAENEYLTAKVEAVGK